MRHLHADVLIAIAEGKEVEYHTEAHNWRTPSTDTVNPITFPGLLWRVKPEPEAEWKQKLRQAAREGKRIEYLDHKGEWVDCLINSVNPDAWDFFGSIEADYRIVPKTVTRWKWALQTPSDGWWERDDFMTDDEATDRLGQRKRIKLEYTRTEFPS